MITIGVYPLANLKKYTFPNSSLIYLTLFFKLGSFIVEGPFRHIAGFGRLPEGYFFAAPCLMHLIKVFRQGSGWSAELHSARFGGGNALGLPLTDAHALILRHKGQHLQNDVREEGSHQIFAPTGIQQRHIQYHNVDPFFLGQNTPLLQNFSVVAPQTVDALDIEQIVFFHAPHHFSVLRAVKVLTALLVHVDIFLRDAETLHNDELPVLVLITAADSDVAVIFCDTKSLLMMTSIGVCLICKCIARFHR